MNTLATQSEPEPAGASPDAAYEDMCRRVAGNNIHEETLLATDYLNHFNEVIMLLEMLPDMPDLLDEVKAWQPKSYEQHFTDSGLSIGELAIAAYALAPPRHKVPFDQTVGQMDRVVLNAIERLEQARNAEDVQSLRLIARGTTHALQRLNEAASGIIHGSEQTMEQADIDALLADNAATADGATADDGAADTQADIDAMFSTDTEADSADDDGGDDIAATTVAAVAQPSPATSEIVSRPARRRRKPRVGISGHKRDRVAEELSRLDIDALFDRRVY